MGDLSSISDKDLLSSIETDLNANQESNLATAGKGAGRAAVSTAGNIANLGPNIVNLGTAAAGLAQGTPTAVTGKYGPLAFAGAKPSGVPPNLPFEPDLLSNYISGLVSKVMDLRNTRTDPLGKAVSTGSELATGAVLSGGGLTGTARDVGLNVVAPALGGVAGEALAGEGGKIAGAVGAPLATSVASRAAFGGQAIPRLRQMEAAGISPTAADVTDRLSGAQGWLAKLPFGRGIAEAAREKQAAQSEKKVADLVKSVGEDFSNLNLREKAGETMAEGLSNWKDRAYKIYDKFKAITQDVFPPDTKAVPRAYMVKLAEQTQTSATAPATSQPNPVLAKLLANLESDVQGGAGMTVADLKRIRDRDIAPYAFPEGPTLNVGVDKRQYQNLYHALNEDIKRAAPSEAARKALEAENSFYAAFAKRRDDYIDAIYKRAELRPEETLNRLMSGAKKGASDVREAMRSITAPERDVIASSQLQMMGRNRSGEFTPETFYSHYNALVPEAKQALFGGTSNRSMMRDMDTLTAAFNNIKRGVEAGANPSGTAKEVAGVGTLVGGVARPLRTLFGLAVGATAETLLTNPTVVKWAAETAALPKADLSVQLNRLYNMSRGEKDPRAKAAIDDFIEQAGKQQK